MRRIGVQNPFRLGLQYARQDQIPSPRHRARPVLNFALLDRFDPALPRECFVTDIFSYSSLIPHTRSSVNRAVGAALFFIRQVASGNVPDVNRVLRIYKLHPAQAFLYRSDRRPERDLKDAFESGRAAQGDWQA